MFRTSVVHLQERSYAVCCDLVCLDTSCCYEGEGRTALQIYCKMIRGPYNIKILFTLTAHIEEDIPVRK